MSDAVSAAVERARTVVRQTRRLSWFDRWAYAPQHVLIAHEIMACGTARLDDIKSALDRVYPNRSNREDKYVSILIAQMRKRMAPFDAKIIGDVKQGWRFDPNTYRALLDEQRRAA